jgi:tetratricopeptide (TPR) repeat protein
VGSRAPNGGEGRLLFSRAKCSFGFASAVETSEFLKYFGKWYGPKSYAVAVNPGQPRRPLSEHRDARRAEKHFRKAIAVEESLLGNSHPDVALSLNNLAVVLAGRGARAEALKTYRRALAVFETTVGKKHPHYRGCEKNLQGLIDDDMRRPRGRR